MTPPEDRDTSNLTNNVPPEEQLSPYEMMLQSAPADYLTNLEGAPTIDDLPPEFPVYYFFYGSLTKPENLKRILDSSEDPQLRKAHLVGYALAKWGDYPALIDDGEEPSRASGRTFMYAGDAQALLEGRFDRKLWRIQMAGKLG